MSKFILVSLLACSVASAATMLNQSAFPHHSTTYQPMSPFFLRVAACTGVTAAASLWYLEYCGKKKRRCFKKRLGSSTLGRQGSVPTTEELLYSRRVDSAFIGFCASTSVCLLAICCSLTCAFIVDPLYQVKNL